MAEKHDEQRITEKDEKESDAELNSLLDSALIDFGQSSKPESSVKSVTVEDGSGSSIEEKDVEGVWNEFFKKAMSLDSTMASQSNEGDGTSDNFTVNFQKIAEAAAKALEEPSDHDEFSAAIAQTLKNLSENTESLQNQFGDPDKIANMFETLGLSATDSVGQPPQFFPFFQQIMQTFLSKEVLYPSMKELLDKYPAWLQENSDKISPSDLARYKKQQKIMTLVCTEFELESETDSEQETEKRFKKIMELMERMQACGQPPQELMGNMTMSVDGQGMPNLPPGIEPDQCSIA